MRQIDFMAMTFCIKNRVCLQMENLCSYLQVSPVASLIESLVFNLKPNGKVSCYINFSNPTKAIEILIGSPYFINADLGSLHKAELNDFVFDFRSRTNGAFKFGEMSLQINIGKTNGRARADLDNFNPKEGLFSLIGHSLEVINLL